VSIFLVFVNYHCQLNFLRLGSLRAVVTDGVTLGRPCCKVHNCSKPLPNNRAHFCINHESQKSTCVVTDCTYKAQDGFRTCSERTHREMEEKHKESGKAFFQLRLRLARHNTTQLPDSLNTEANIPEDEDEDQVLTHKSETGNRVPKARFARRRTHNEQLIVSCCGVVLARGTMFGAEAISGVKVRLSNLYL